MVDTPQVNMPQRPVSPHLFIYRPIVTMVASILHRITGATLYVGTLLLIWFLLAASIDVSAFNQVEEVMHSWFGRLVLFGFTWALLNHLLGGIRHLLTDYGFCFDAPQSDWLAQINLVGGLVLTVLFWLLYFFM